MKIIAINASGSVSPFASPEIFKGIDVEGLVHNLMQTLEE